MTKTSQAPARSRAGSASKGRNGSKPPDARGAKGRKKKAPDHELDQDMDPELQEQFIAALGNLTGGIDSVGAVLLWNLLIACVPERHRQRDRYHLAGFMWLIEQRSDDPIEMLLKIQLWVAHITAMDCLAHATLTNQSFDGRNMELKHAERFLNLSVRLEQALARRGGRPQQTVRVEHLSVAPGGQAVVANVQAAANVANRDMPSQLAPGDAASDATPRPPSARQGVA